jgi:hypothetical protein
VSKSTTHARALERQARDAETESRNDTVALHETHIAALQRAEREDGLEGDEVIVSAAHHDVAVGPATTVRSAPPDVTPGARHQVLERVVAQTEWAITEFFPAGADSV